ncbi:MAG: EspA/EspE family type VII secretion system effector [Mycobacterium sp.]
MGPIEGFLTTWSRALQTFGQGVPAAGSDFSGSAALRELKAQVESAAPGDQWLGGAATAYAAANDEHALVFGKLADLDARLAAEVDKSAGVVTSGRGELDKVREWVLSAASSVPDNQAGQMMLISIVSKGLGQLSAIVSRTNGELNAIGAQIQQVGEEYAALSQQKFAG